MNESQHRYRLRMAAAAKGIPLHCIPGLVDYIVAGQEPGDFLLALLEGRLFDAVDRADDENMHALACYARFLFNDCPAGCFRSRQRVDAWIQGGGLMGRLVPMKTTASDQPSSAPN